MSVIVRGIAVVAVPGPELALEVGAPDGVGCIGLHRAGARVFVGAPPAPGLRQAVAGQQIPGAAGGGQGQIRLFFGEPGQEFAWPPGRVHTAGFEQRLRDLGGHSLARHFGRTALLPQPVQAILLIAGHPLVAGLAADGETVTEFRHRVEPLVVQGDKMSTFGHRISRFPGHGAPLRRVCPVLPRHELRHWMHELRHWMHELRHWMVDCYRCCRSVVLPMLPVCCVTYVPGLYRGMA